MKTIFIITLLLLFSSCINTKNELSQLDSKNIQEKPQLVQVVQEVKIEQNFLSSWLKTDTSKLNIPFDEILNWWPGKDGIPSINNPKFITIDEANKSMDFLKEESNWISVEVNWKAKFYPYEILVWHEIVNDELWWEKIAVTFCPLCWSAIVYDRIINWEELIFWVSWLLYESNLLMYDNKTESLWSQSLWKSVVWDYLWRELKYIKSNLMTFKNFKNNYLDGLVLSNDTWFSRDYWNIPYWDYNENDILYFPVNNNDWSYDKKEIFYIINDWNESIAFVFNDLRKIWKWEIKIWDKLYIASFKDWIVNIKNWEKVLNWYYEMWFSWVNHNIWNKNIWSK